MKLENFRSGLIRKAHNEMRPYWILCYDCDKDTECRLMDQDYWECLECGRTFHFVEDYDWRAERDSDIENRAMEERK